MKSQLFFLLCAITVVYGVSKVGKTTRYWDCCKPSCSWSNKAPVSAPVKTCDKGGVNGVNSETTNVCGGGGAPGKAYTCNNNQPVQINSSLSFGFVAGAVAGQSEYNS